MAVATGVQATRTYVRRATAVAVASLLLVANLLASWHQATVAHARCAEHGELIHAGHAAPSADAALAAAQDADRVDRLWARSGSPDGDGEDHDHCQICPLTREPLRLEQPLRIAAPVGTPVAAAPSPTVVPVASAVDLVRIAPKTSPPV